MKNETLFHVVKLFPYDPDARGDRDMCAVDIDERFLIKKSVFQSQLVHAGQELLDFGMLFPGNFIFVPFESQNPLQSITIY